MTRYKKIFTRLPQPALILNPSGAIAEANLAAVGMFGLNGSAGGPDTSSKRVAAWLGEAVEETSSPFSFVEKQFEDGSGRPRWFRIRPARVDETEEQGSVVLLTDITERRRFLEELERHASIVNSCEDAIMGVAPDGVILSANKAMAEVYGLNDWDAVGLSVFRFVPGDRRPETAEILDRVFNGDSVARHESWGKRDDGSLFPLSATYSPIECFGKIIGVSAIIRDITERKNAEQALLTGRRKLAELLDETVNALSTTLEIRDLYTSGHQQRVAAVTEILSQRLGCGPERREGLRIAALLHDIGKISIPMAILSKPCRLDPDEMNIIKKHSKVGFQILHNIPFPWPVGKMILQHHERMDGSGYPEGLTGSEIEDGAKILAVADVLEAMSSHRPYRPALGLDAAMEEFKEGRRRKYDEDVCEALEELVAQRRIINDNGVLKTCR